MIRFEILLPLYYHDQLIHTRLDVADPPENRQALRGLKEILKLRFEQLDIWITAHRIDIL
jgi:hypothetical protein